MKITEDAQIMEQLSADHRIPHLAGLDAPALTAGMIQRGRLHRAELDMNPVLTDDGLSSPNQQQGENLD